MKNGFNGSARTLASTLRAGRANGRVAVAAAPLQRVRCKLTHVTQALATSRQEAQTAWKYIQTLMEINSRLNRELIELARREAQVRDFAYHDELTGLPNRRLLLDRLNQAVAQAARQHKHVVLLLVDLDGFKSVNDRLGHAGGDKVLQAVAKRLTSAIRGADTACRYGGDEFLIMLPEVDNQEMADPVWGKLKLALSEPYIIDGYQVRLTASMGSVAYPTDGRTDEELIRRADGALYRAKARSGNARITALPMETGVGADKQYSATVQRPGQVRNDELEFQQLSTRTSSQR